jgi:flagellar biosynthesis/type III secretory pathway protein FliH
MVQEALGGSAGTQLVTLRVAVEKIAPIFGIENIDAALDALEEELEQKAEQQQEQFEREQETVHAMAEGLSGGTKPIGNRPASGGKPPQAAGG